MALLKPSLVASKTPSLLHRSTTDTFMNDDGYGGADVDGITKPHIVHQSRPPVNDELQTLRCGLQLNLKRTISTGYGSTKRRQAQKKFQIAERQFIIFLRAVVSNIIQPSKARTSKSSSAVLLDAVFDATLSVFRFHISSFHKFCSNIRRSPNKAAPPVFRYYAMFPHIYAAFLDTTFKAIPHIESIASQIHTMKWFADKCREISFLSDGNNTHHCESLAEVLRDVCTHCITQSNTLRDLATSRHYTCNKDAKIFRKNIKLYLEKSYIKQWNEEYKQKLNLLHLEMTLRETQTNNIYNVSSLQTTEQQCTLELNSLNHKMLSLKNEFNVYAHSIPEEKMIQKPKKNPEKGLKLIINKPSHPAQGLKITVTRSIPENENVFNMKTPNINMKAPTPVSDEKMFKYFKKIDMGQSQISSLDIFATPVCFSPQQSQEFKFFEDDDDEHSELDGDDDDDEYESHSELDESDDDDEDSDDGFSFMDFLTDFSTVTEDTVYAEHGYRKLNKICDTLQGELLKGQQISNGAYIMIKRANKELVESNEAIMDDLMCYVAENRVKEGWILKYLSNDTPISEYITKYIDYFETDDDCYLVMEYVESGINFKQFVQIAKKYIKENKLKWAEYHKCVKELYWQLVITVDWFHNTMHCCHLDLCLENIMLKDCSFIEQNDGFLIINPNTSIKVADFGVAEVFEDSFECTKQDLSINNDAYNAPKVRADRIYDARAADMWSLGMILFYAMTGEPLYKAAEVCQAEIQPDKRRSVTALNLPNTQMLESTKTHGHSSSMSSDFMCNGYWSLHHGSLKEYLTTNGKVRHFDRDSYTLLINLLKVSEKSRVNARAVVEYIWFEEQHQKYEKLIVNSRNQAKKIDFPFYKMC